MTPNGSLKRMKMVEFGSKAVLNTIGHYQKSWKLEILGNSFSHSKEKRRATHLTDEMET